MEKKKSIIQEMGSFPKDGRSKSSFFVYAVCLSFLFIVIHIITISVLVGPVHDFFTGLRSPLSGGWLNLFESGIPALLSAVLCNIPVFFLRDKRIILAAYLFILLYLVIIVITVLITYTSDERYVFLAFFRTVIPAPIISGFVVSGGVFAVYYKRKKR